MHDITDKGVVERGVSAVAGARPSAGAEPVLAPRGVRALWERGLTTVEYAVGIVLVIAVVGLLVKAASEGWFMDLVRALVGTIFKVITTALLG